MGKPIERKNRMEKNNAEKPSQSSAWMKGALYNLGKAAEVGAAIVVAENIVGADAHPTGPRGSEVVPMNGTTVHDSNTSAHGESRSSAVVFMNDKIPTQQADWRNHSNLADVPPRRNGSSSADVPRPKSSFLDEFGDRLKNGSSYADLFEKPTPEQNQKLDGGNSSLDVPSPPQSGQPDSKNVTEISVVRPRDVNHSHSGDIERIKRMIDFANENPSRIAEMLRRKPKMVENAIKAISKDPEIIEFATRAYQEFQKHQSGELVRREGSKLGEQLSGKLVRRDDIDQNLQNQIDILRDRVSSADRASTLATVALTLSGVLAMSVGIQIFYNNPRFAGAIATLAQQQQQNLPLPPVGPAQNA